MNDLISIVVPIYKVEKYIRKCIDSIINQTYKNLEIILVDDGSPDNCPNIIEEYAKKDSRIKVIHKQNGGQSSARNAGIKIATGEYIGFVDGDDMLNVRMYEKLYSTLKKYDADISICGHLKTYENELGEIVFPENVEEIEEKVLSRSETLKKILMDPSIGNFPTLKLFKKCLFEDIFFPEGKVYEDAATIYKLVHKATKIAYTNEKLYYYLYGRIGATTSSFSEKKILDSLDAYYGQYLFLKENYKELNDYANITWVKMYTSAMEKICMNGYVELWNREDVVRKYNDFKKAMNELNDELLYKWLEPYRIISAVLLNHSREMYKNMFEVIFNNLKNK